jgi:hypothetical protein
MRFAIVGSGPSALACVLPFNETVDSLLSLVSEIELLEITSLQSPVNEFNVPLKL